MVGQFLPNCYPHQITQSITIELSDQDLVVCAVYIFLAPTVSIDYYKELYDYLYSLCDTRKVVLLGDFNLMHLTFSNETAKSERLST